MQIGSYSKNVISIDDCSFIYKENFYGKSFDALYALEPIGSHLSSLRSAIKLISKEYGRRYLILRYVDDKKYKKILQYFKAHAIPMENAYRKFGCTLYQSEENFPQVIYNINKLFLNEEDGSIYPLFAVGNKAGKRYNDYVKRIKKFFPDVYINEAPKQDDLLAIVDSWKRNIQEKSRKINTINNIIYDYDQIEANWFFPIESFVNKLQTSNSIVSNTITRMIVAKVVHKGFWTGYRVKDYLYIYIFLSDRSNNFISDLLFWDIFSHARKIGVRYINFGGSENHNLYYFKKKYFNYFSSSYEINKRDIFFDLKEKNV